MLPAASVALTRKVCEPLDGPLYSAVRSLVEGQRPNAAPSRLHWKVETASEEAKVNVASPPPLTVPVGPVTTVVSGAAVPTGRSTVTLSVAEESDWSPAASVAVAEIA